MELQLEVPGVHMTAGKSGSTPQSDLWIKKLEPQDRKLELF